MIGAIIGDIVGSRFEFNNVKTTHFDLFAPDSTFTDDSVMTIAIAKSLMDVNGNYSLLGESVVSNMRELGNKYPDRGYGGRFARWLISDNPEPYYSYGNGAAMRVSAVAYVARSVAEVMSLSRIVTEVTHNHPEGIKGAEAIAMCTYLALHDAEMDEIRACAFDYYDLDFTLDEIRDDYIFHVDSMESVNVALEAFFESSDFEDAIRLAVSVGGDSDTIGAMTGAIAGAYYGVPYDIERCAMTKLDKYLLSIVTKFQDKYM